MSSISKITLSLNYQYLPDLSRHLTMKCIFGRFSFFTTVMAKQGKILYKKLPKTFEDQVNLLKARGLNFENEQKAEKIKKLKLVCTDKIVISLCPCLN